MAFTEAVRADVGRDQFLNLLVTQLRHQNPLDPIQDQEFVAQLAQFSSLEGIEKLNANFADMLLLQQLTQGSNLLGRTVAYDDPASGSIRQGTVSAAVMLQGKLHLTINGSSVPLDSIKGIINR